MPAPDRRTLTSEIATPTLTGIRSPLAGTPADGLDPVRLAAILRAADQGDGVAYLELAEAIEERDAHYLAVLSTRKRQVAQLEATVEAASDSPRDLEIADRLRAWLARDTLTDELFHILDALGKGISFTEIVWERSAGQWAPARLEWRDPRWFRLAPDDLATPLLVGEDGQARSLPWGKFIAARMPAKSGLPLRSGLARIAAWGWLFKAYTLRDWAIFVQTYGQPLRLGKWHAGASEEDRDTLFRAVANIAGDCAAIIPETMQIEFVEARGTAQAADLYERRCDWLDRQISKAVLGQTATTDAIAGGHAVSREHREVQADIERADAAMLSAILNRDLIRPWVTLEWGADVPAPRLRLARPRAEDRALMAETLARLVPLGLRVEESEVRDRLGFADPAPGAAVLGQPGAPAPGLMALQAAAAPDPAAHMAALADRLEEEAQPAVAAMIGRIEAMLDAAGSLEEARAMLLAAFPRIDAAPLAAALGRGLVAAHLAGRAAVAEESDG